MDRAAAAVMAMPITPHGPVRSARRPRRRSARTRTAPRRHVCERGNRDPVRQCRHDPLATNGCRRPRECCGARGAAGALILRQINQDQVLGGLFDRLRLHRFLVDRGERCELVAGCGQGTWPPLLQIVRTAPPPPPPPPPLCWFARPSAATCQPGSARGLSGLPLGSGSFGRGNYQQLSGPPGG
jgi:hypothetical protein